MLTIAISKEYVSFKMQLVKKPIETLLQDTATLTLAVTDNEI